MRIKICGLTRPQDAAHAESAGADLVGAILVPGSPRQVSPELARELGRNVSIPLAVVVADLTPRQTARLAEEAGAGVIQLHGAEPPAFLQALRELGGWELWKAVRVRSEADVLQAFTEYRGSADLVLLDGWHPERLGGTGIPFDWSFAASAGSLGAGSPALGVAGGLDPDNVRGMVEALRPDLVDVSSGVEVSPGIKDHARISDFVRSAREGASGGDAPLPPPR